MICFAKLPIITHIKQIQKEVDTLSSKWYPHLNSSHYEGSWNVISLRSPDGKSNTIVPELMGNIEFKDTELMVKCPSIKKLINRIECPILSVRLLNLKSGAKIKPHRDMELAFEHGEARLHIPVFTNNDILFFVEKHRVKMLEGECWYINANLQHHVSNNGVNDRIHLVIDCVVNEWLKDLFEKAEKTTREEKKDMVQIHQIIEQLRLQNTDTANTIASNLLKELNNE